MKDEVRIQLENLKQIIGWIDNIQLAKDAQEVAYLMLRILREQHSKHPAAFDSDTVQNLDELAAELRSKHKLKEGMFVRHISKDIEGRIDGKTRLKQRFECTTDIFEYRVKTADGSIKLCSPVNLECYASLYDSHCWKCNSKIDDKLERCRNCGWYICAKGRCKSCGCGFYRFYKSRFNI